MISRIARFAAVIGAVMALAVAPSPRPSVSSLLKPEVLKRVKDREIRTYAKLEKTRYEFYAAMQVRAGVRAARETLTTYPLYKEMVPFVSRSEKQGELLRIEGGVFGWKLASSVLIQELSPEWLSYRIVSGHLRGLAGRVLFEPVNDRETLVFFDGGLEGERWPPAFVMERGAEIVFGLTADRMRSLIEKRESHAEEKDTGKNKGKIEREEGNDGAVPQPKKGRL